MIVKTTPTIKGQRYYKLPAEVLNYFSVIVKGKITTDIYIDLGKKSRKTGNDIIVCIEKK